MTDPKKSQPEDEDMFGGLEEIQPEEQQSTPPPVEETDLSQLFGEEPANESPPPDQLDLSAMFGEEPLVPPPVEAAQTNPDSSETDLSALLSGDSSDSSGAFHVLDESALNDAANRADSSDISGTISDPDISDILEEMGEVSEKETTETRQAAGMLTSSSEDSSGDLVVQAPGAGDDYASSGNDLGVMPTNLDDPPVSPPQSKKPKKEPKEETPKPRRGGVLVGMTMGLMGGLAVSQGLWLFGIELPHTIRQTDPSLVLELKSQAKDAKEFGAKAASLEGELAESIKSAEDSAGKAKAEIDKHLMDKTALATRLDEQAKTHEATLKAERGKAEKTLKDSVAAMTKDMDDLKSSYDTKLTKLEKDLDTAKADAKVELEKANSETAKEKARANGLEGKLAADAKVWTALAGNLKASGFGETKAEAASLAPLLEKAVGLAAIKDPAGEIRKLSSDLAKEKARLEAEIMGKDSQVKARDAELARRRDPAETLENWRLILSSDIPDSRLAKDASRDAALVLAKAAPDSPEASKAKIVAALADAVQGKLAEAKKTLATTKSETAGPWSDTAKSLATRLASPSSVAITKARELIENGKRQQAFDLLTNASASPLPDDAALPRLRAELALLLLTGAKPDLGKAESLATEASKSKEALAFYVLGRITETKGGKDEAGVLFARAIEAAKPDDPMMLQYRLARLRLLKAASGGINSSTALLPDDEALQALMLVALIALADTEVLPVRDPRELARKREIKAILDDPKAPPLLKSQVLLEDDQPFLALEKLREHLASRDTGTDTETVILLGKIAKALESKSAGSDSVTLSPLARRDEANRLFGKGKRFVLEGKFEQAEETLKLAAKYAGKEIDARFEYFLGLAQWGYGEKAAAEKSFIRALELERRNIPSAREVSRALEEVQGPVREKIDSIRYGAVLAPASFR